MLGVKPCREPSKVDLSQRCEVEPDNPAIQLVSQLSTCARLDVLLMAEAPIGVLGSDHLGGYSFVWSRVVERPGDPFASFDLAVVGSAHVVSGLSC
jgi:hypothetical protein